MRQRLVGLIVCERAFTRWDTRCKLKAGFEVIVVVESSYKFILAVSKLLVITCSDLNLGLRWKQFS